MKLPPKVVTTWERMLKGKSFTVVFEPEGERLAMRMGSTLRGAAKGELIGYVWIENGELRFDVEKLIPISLDALRSLIREAWST